MSEIKYKKASVFYLLGNLFNKGIGFLTVPIFTRILSTSDYGIVTTYNSWIGILAMLFGFALHMSIRRAFVDYKKEIDEFMSSIILFVWGFLLLCVVLAMAFWYICKPALSFFIVILCFTQATCTAIIEDYSNYLMMKYQYRKRTLLLVAPNLLGVIFSVIVIMSICKRDFYLGRIVPTAVVCMLFGIVISIISLRRGMFKFKSYYLKYALAISAPLIFHGMALYILAQADRTMITFLANASQTGIYSLVYNFGMIATVITTGFDGVWVPWFIDKMEKKQFAEINCMAKKYINLMTYAMGGLLLISPELVKILAEKSYWEGVVILPPIMLSNFVVFSYSLYVHIEHFYKKTMRIAINTIIAAIINVVLNYLLIPQFGYCAAAYTTLISYIVVFALHAQYAKKIENKLYSVKYFCIPVALLLFVVFFFYIFLNSILLRWGISLIYICIGIYSERKFILKMFPGFKSLKND